MAPSYFKYILIESHPTDVGWIIFNLSCWNLDLFPPTGGPNKNILEAADAANYDGIGPSTEPIYGAPTEPNGGSIKIYFK